MQMTAPLGSPGTHAKIYRVASYEDAYTKCFHAAIVKAGVDAHRGSWGIRWLIATVRRGDILHLHWPSDLYYEGSKLRTWLGAAKVAVGLFIARVRGARVVWTAHNLYPHDGGSDVLVHRVVRRLVVMVSCHICVHGYAAAEIVGREFSVPRQRLVVLEHGNWIGYYQNTISKRAARVHLGVSESSFMFLFIGLCRPYKNLEILVKSHSEMNDDSLLWIVGRFPSDSYYSSVKKGVDARNRDRVEIRNGFVADEDMQLYLNACDVVVLPYKEVLTSGSVMLALSFGRPVVAPNIGALGEVVTEECGVLYDPACEGGLQKAMLSSRGKNVDRERILARAREFSWDRSAQIYADKVVNCSR